jgi:predicted RNase H-like HicB family nuclease
MSRARGDSEDEALANIRKALGAALSVYREEKTAIPWAATPVDPALGAKTRWVIVHA